MKPREISALETHVEMVNPEFDSLVQGIIHAIERPKLENLKNNFHTRLRITPTQPENTEIMEHLWDFFYDWCVFEEKLADNLKQLPKEKRDTWTEIKDQNTRGLFSIQKTTKETLKVQDLYSKKSYLIKKNPRGNFAGINKGDIIEGRLFGPKTENKKEFFNFVRRPSFHPSEVHQYIKTKIRSFKKAKDFDTYQSWLWLLVGMYLKHRLYSHMPVVKIYDDNSRI